jgi:D-glycero-D-manno-heptose 1,7-bisphosphate phosphatase
MSVCSERVIILDRDGVINEDSDEYIKSVAEWKPLPRSIDAIARLSHAGYRIAVASNQSGIGRGLFPLSELNAMHQLLRELVAAQGGRIEMIAFCPHTPNEQCDCRKPNIGLLTEIANRMNINLTGVPLIGDSASDISAARRANAAPWLVLTGKGERTVTQLKAAGDSLNDVIICPDLYAAATQLLHQKH